MTQICVSRLTIIDSDNGLSPDRRQAIIWTNAGILLIGPLWTNFCEILIEIPTFSFKKMRLKVSSAKWRPFCLGLNVLSKIKAWINNHAHHFMSDVITHLCPTFNGSFTKQSLKLSHGWIISPPVNVDVIYQHRDNDMNIWLNHIFMS